MSWATKELGEVAELDRSSISASEIEPGTNYLGLEHIESGGKILEVPKVTNGELASSKFRFTKDHLLYGKLRPYLAKIALPTFSGICSTDIIPVLPGPGLDRRYLCYFLRQGSMVEYANSRAAGANLPRLSPKELAKIEIPLPPLAEQKRIAGILDAADALRAKRRGKPSPNSTPSSKPPSSTSSAIRSPGTITRSPKSLRRGEEPSPTVLSEATCSHPSWSKAECRSSTFETSEMGNTIESALCMLRTRRRSNWMRAKYFRATS